MGGVPSHPVPLDHPLLLSATGLERLLGDQPLWSRLDLPLAGGERQLDEPTAALDGGTTAALSALRILVNMGLRRHCDGACPAACCRA